MSDSDTQVVVRTINEIHKRVMEDLTSEHENELKKYIHMPSLLPYPSIDNEETFVGNLLEAVERWLRLELYRLHEYQDNTRYGYEIMEDGFYDRVGMVQDAMEEVKTLIEVMKDEQ